MTQYIFLFLAPLSSLLLLTIGSSFLTTLLILNFKAVGQSSQVVGLLTSCFYFGYIIGAFKLERFIQRVGYIRAYSSFASMIAIISILHGITDNAPLWLFLRFIYGACNAGLMIVVESWLLNLSSIEIRGRILALYMVSFYIAQALGQFFFDFVSLVDFIPYAIITIFASLSIIPLCATRRSSPLINEASVLSIKSMLSISKSAILGCLTGGLVLGSVYGIFPLTLKSFNYTEQDIGVSMGFILLGGALFQYPIGKLSDLFNRRNILLLIAILTLILSIGLFLSITRSHMLFNLLGFIFGGLSFTLYPVSINLACDYVDSDNLVAAIGSLLIFYSIGATLSPSITPLFLNIFGPNGVFYFIFGVCFILVAMTLRSKATRDPLPMEEQGDFVSTPSTTPVASELNPRIEEDLPSSSGN